VPRSAPAGTRAENPDNEQFGRQLDAARQQHASDDRADAKTDAAPARDAGTDAVAQADPADIGTLAAVARVAGQAPETGVRTAADKPADDTDQAAVIGIPQCVLTLCLPDAIAPRAVKGGLLHALPSSIAANPGKDTMAAAAQAILLANASPADAATATPFTDGHAPVPATLAQILASAKPALREASATGDAGTTAVAAPPPQTGAPALAQVQVLAPVGTPAFAAELNQQITWFATQDIKQARIRLHPEELGMLDLKISVQHGKVDVAFTAQHPGAVLALQQSLPQLDQMLAQQGLSLGHSEVGQHGREDAPGQGRGNGDDRDGAIDEVSGVGAVAVTRSLNLLDAFA
jgi:flagellar hook-length control protein FliK